LRGATGFECYIIYLRRRTRRPAPEARRRARAAGVLLIRAEVATRVEVDPVTDTLTLPSLTDLHEPLVVNPPARDAEQYQTARFTDLTELREWLDWLEAAGCTESRVVLRADSTLIVYWR
jgi:hypothetical protein